jgi:hypothetical protein
VSAAKETPGKAVFVKKLTGFYGEARLYKVTPPLDGHEHVAVSAVVAYSGPETYIFPADADGKVLSWGELDGSFRGDLDHEAALRLAGYEVTR